MAGIFQKLKRILSALIGFGLAGREDAEAADLQAVDDMKRKLADLRASTAGVIANEHRIGRLLAAEEAKLAQLDADAEQPGGVGGESRDSEKSRRDLCASWVEDLRAQHESAHRQAVDAQEELAFFQEELRQASERARDARIQYQLAQMRAQAEKLRLSSPLDEDLAAIDRMKDRADSALAEARALAELNEALGRAEPQSPGADFKMSQEEQTHGQRIMGSDVPEEKPE